MYCRARRLAKKRLKERGRRARAGWHSSHQGYTDHDNPFGDAALTDAFVWGKKLAKLGPSTATPEELERINRQTQIENKIELEKVPPSECVTVSMLCRIVKVYRC